MKTWVAVAMMVAPSGAAPAALIDRGGGMIDDTTRNVTWLADMNDAQTSGHTGTGVNANGTMNLAAATAWANNLVYGGFSDWRMPTPNPNGAWFFRTFVGLQNIGSKGSTGSALYAVAVRPGEVTASMPEPHTLALVLLALGATVVARRRRPA